MSQIKQVIAESKDSNPKTRLNQTQLVSKH